ncbi:MAG: alpha/beta fold hydrolase [Myxococcota bacterium]
MTLEPAPARPPQASPALPPNVPRALYPFEGRFFERNGLRLHYLDEGPGGLDERPGGPDEGPGGLDEGLTASGEGAVETVVMVHGNPTWSFYYRDLVRALRERYRVLVPDHIGCGLSDKPDEATYAYTLSSRVDDLEAWLAHVVPEGPVTLVAHDWGGMIAMGWAARHPERVARIVLMNTAAFHLPDDMRMPATLAFVRNTGLASWLVRHANLFARGATWLASARWMPKTLRDAYCAPYDTPANRIATLRFVQDIPLSPGDAAWEAVSAIESALPRFQETPVLLLWGQRDFVFRPAVCDVFERVWPHAETRRFARAGHYVLEDAADEIPPLVRDFLARHPIAAAPEAVAGS